MGLAVLCSEIRVLLTAHPALYCDQRHLWAGRLADCYPSAYGQIINDDIIWR